MWQAGEWKAFCEMLPEYAAKGHGEGFMHDTAMLLGALGWTRLRRAASRSSRRTSAPRAPGRSTRCFPVTPQDGRAIPKPVASAAAGYQALRPGSERRHAPPGDPLHPAARCRDRHAGLCRTLADAMLRCATRHGAQVFPTGGTRVLAYPARALAVADGSADYAFVYLNLRMARGRSAAVHQARRRSLAAVVREALRAAAGRAPGRPDAADRRRPRGLRRQARQPAPAVQQETDHHARPRTPSPHWPAELYDARKSRTPLRHFSKQHPGHDDRRRLRHPARLGGAGAGRRPHHQGPQDRPDLARDAAVQPDRRARLRAADGRHVLRQRRRHPDRAASSRRASRSSWPSSWASR